MDADQKAARDFILRAMEATGLDATALARKAGLAHTTLTRIVYPKDDGAPPKHSSSARTLAKVAAVAGISMAGAVSGRRRMVPVVGYVGAGERVEPVPTDGDQPLEEIEGPSDLDEDAVAVIVRGESMFPVYWEGDGLIYTREAGFDPGECLYNECVVKVVNGPTLIKMVMPGTRPGLYTLTSYNAPPRIDQDIEWAAPVKVHDKRRRQRRT